MVHLVVFVASALVFVLATILNFRRSPRDKRPVEVVLVLSLCIAVFSLLSWPSLMEAGPAPVAVPGVTELQSQRVGSYQACVLKIADGQALSAWLKANDLKDLDGPETKVVNDYAVKGWCFVVARLRNEGGGTLTPHPLAATFSTARPIYPMRLTALAGSTTHVELFVVADQQASAQGLDCVAADTFKPHESYKPFQPVYRSLDGELTIGSPDVAEHLWPGCVVTKLTADLKPELMAQDLSLSLGQLKPFRQHFYSSNGPLAPGRDDRNRRGGMPADRGGGGLRARAPAGRKGFACPRYCGCSGPRRRHLRLPHRSYRIR